MLLSNNCCCSKIIFVRLRDKIINQPCQADGSPEAKTIIYENKMAATSAQSPRTTGKKTVEMLYKILDGKKTEKQCIVPVSLITKDNINDYSLSGWQ